MSGELLRTVFCLLIGLDMLILITGLLSSVNLARREMAVVLGTLFSRYDVFRGQEGQTFGLYKTTRERDIDPNSDKIILVPAQGSLGLRVKIRH